MRYGRCPRCDHVMFPVLDRSPCGHDDRPVLEEFDAPGVAYSWTKVHTGAGGSTLMAMADFFDGALRVTAPVLGTEDVAIGDELVLGPGEGTPYALRPV